MGQRPFDKAKVEQPTNHRDVIQDSDEKHHKDHVLTFSIQPANVEEYVGEYSTDPYGIVDAKFLDAVSHQWECFVFPLIAYIVSGKLHINGVNPE